MGNAVRAERVSEEREGAAVVTSDLLLLAIVGVAVVYLICCGCVWIIDVWMDE